MYAVCERHSLWVGTYVYSLILYRINVSPLSITEQTYLQYLHAYICMSDYDNYSLILSCSMCLLAGMLH